MFTSSLPRKTAIYVNVFSDMRPLKLPGPSVIAYQRKNRNLV